MDGNWFSCNYLIMQRIRNNRQTSQNPLPRSHQTHDPARLSQSAQRCYSPAFIGPEQGVMVMGRRLKSQSNRVVASLRETNIKILSSVEIEKAEASILAG